MEDGSGARWPFSAVVGVVFLLVSGCGGPPDSADLPTVRVAYGAPGSTELELSISTCNADPVATADESGADVRVTIEVEPRGSDRGDCLDSAEVTLGRPLGDRAVVDAATGRRVEVLPAED